MIAQRVGPDDAKYKGGGDQDEQAAVVSSCVGHAVLQRIREREDHENASCTFTDGAVNHGFNEVCDGLLCVHTVSASKPAVWLKTLQDVNPIRHKPARKNF